MEYEGDCLTVLMIIKEVLADKNKPENPEKSDDRPTDPEKNLVKKNKNQKIKNKKV